MRIPVLLLTIITLVTTSWTIESATAAGKHSSQLVSSKVLASWGYKRLGRVLYLHGFCDPGIAKQAQVRYQSIKARKSMRGRRGLYPRYTLVQETYPTTEAAIARFNAVKSPAHKTSKHAKMCNLRMVARLDKRVVFVHTDAALFNNKEQLRLLNKLTSKIK